MDTPHYNKDEEHLRLLVIFHYVVAALTALFASFPLIHVGIGIMMVVQPEFMQGGKGSPPPVWFGYIFIVIGAFMVITGWTMAICTFISGRYLKKRKKRMFSFVVGAVQCLFMPFGTILGVFTIIILSRESVQRLYDASRSQT
ncbi:MAG: hypothetical protein RL693_2021 [Verrucomicrobiota bacterium]